MGISIVTDRVSPDEPCYGLSEGPHLVEMPDGSKQWRWTQKVFVVRGDAIAKYETDFGPAEDYEQATPLLMPSYGEETVGVLQEHAGRNRVDNRYWKRRQEMKAESTLIQDILRQEEQKLSLMANRSAFGPGGGFQRNGYPLQHAERQLRERAHGR